MTNGGLARAAVLTPEQRRQIARTAAQTRWERKNTSTALHGGLAERILEALDHARMSQNDLAERSGLSPATIGRVIAGHLPTDGSLAKIAEALDLSPTSLSAGGLEFEQAFVDPVDALLASGEWRPVTPAEIAHLRRLARYVPQACATELLAALQLLAFRHADREDKLEPAVQFIATGVLRRRDK